MELDFKTRFLRGGRRIFLSYLYVNTNPEKSGLISDAKAMGAKVGKQVEATADSEIPALMTY